MGDLLTPLKLRIDLDILTNRLKKLEDRIEYAESQIRHLKTEVYGWDYD